MDTAQTQDTLEMFLSPLHYMTSCIKSSGHCRSPVLIHQHPPDRGLGGRAEPIIHPGDKSREESLCFRLGLSSPSQHPAKTSNNLKGWPLQGNSTLCSPATSGEHLGSHRPRLPMLGARVRSPARELDLICRN